MHLLLKKEALRSLTQSCFHFWLLESYSYGLRERSQKKVVASRLSWAQSIKSCDTFQDQLCSFRLQRLNCHFSASLLLVGVNVGDKSKLSRKLLELMSMSDCVVFSTIPSLVKDAIIDPIWLSAQRTSRFLESPNQPLLLPTNNVNVLL